MKKIYSIGTILFLFAIMFVLVQPVSAVDISTETGDKVVIGESYTLPDGKTLNGRLIIFGGSAVLEEGSIVTDDVILTASDLTVSGEVQGDIISVGGGQVNIKETAKIEGDVIAVASIMEREDGAVIRGDIIGSVPGSLPISLPELPKISFSNLWNDLNPVRNFVSDVFNMLVLSGLAALVLLVAPNSTQKVKNTLMGNPFLSGLFGVLSIIVLPFAVLLLVITLILIPVIPILVLFLVLVMLWGWIALGYLIGKKLEDVFHLNWAEPLVAALGTFALTLLVNSLGWLNSCCLEFPVTVLLLSAGLGSVFLSRFGTQEYIREAK